MESRDQKPMNYDLPGSIESDIQEFAKSEHISADEAVVRLVQTGLKAGRNSGTTRRKRVNVLDLLRQAPQDQTPLEPNSATEFFNEIRKTEGYKTKAAAHRHVQNLRNEWR